MCFPVVNFPLRTTFVQTTSGRLLILLRDFIFQPFSMIDFISPTIKDHYIKGKCAKCFREGITKSWTYYHFAARPVVKNFSKQLQQTNILITNKNIQMTRLEKNQLISKRNKGRSNYFCSKLFLANIPLMVQYFEQFTNNRFLDQYCERLFHAFHDVPILYPLKLSK